MSLESSNSSSPPLQFRFGTVADAAAVSAFARRLFDEAFGPDNSPTDMAMYTDVAFSPAAQSRELADPSRTYLLGEHDGTIAAYALVRTGSTDPAVSGPSPIELERFYVDALWRGSGVAHVMMDQVMEIARARGGETLWLGVWGENRRGIRFYTKRGFRDVGSHPFLLGTDLQTDRVMMRSLVDGE
ncbi:MAG: GNAT family N-acetyltransferase [Gemmatimonadota bacterium]